MSSIKTSTVLALLAYLPAVLSHGHWIGTQIKGTDKMCVPSSCRGVTCDHETSRMMILTLTTRVSHHPLSWKWPPLYNQNFVPYTDLNKPDIICGLSASPAPGKITVPAGSTVDLLWKWPSDTSHPGCIFTYMAPCKGPCKDVDMTKLEFVKIQEKCLLSGPAGKHRTRWATDDLTDNKWPGDPTGERFTYSFTVPKEFADDEWVVRSEINALMFNNKQFYPNCGTFEITGGGGVVPKGTRGMELYSLEKDPGLRTDWDASTPTKSFGPHHSQSPARRVRSDSPRRRAAARRSMKAVSAVVSSSTPGVLVTTMPRSSAASTSTLS